MIRRPPRSTRTDTSFPTRRSSDLVFGAAAWFDEVEAASASETGQIARADRAFRIAGDTPGVNAARARHALRAGRFDEAARVAEQAVAYPEGKIGRAHV